MEKGVTLIDNVITGLSQLFIASDAYEIYMNATGAVVDESTHMLTIDPASLPSLQSLLFEIDGVCILSMVVQVGLLLMHISSPF